MKLSIILPALNEASGIVATLTVLQPLRAAGHELIVVDGGSVDATALLASVDADQVINSARGRAMQMNAGAAAASGDALLFLHADTRLPAQADSLIQNALQDSLWGRFDVEISGHPAMLRVVAGMMNRRSQLTGIATGDQAMFMTRAAFDAAGGYPEQPLMEDIERPAGLFAPAGGHFRPALGTFRRLAHHPADVATALRLLARRAG